MRKIVNKLLIGIIFMAMFSMSCEKVNEAQREEIIGESIKSTFSVSATTYYVRTDGNNNNNGLSNTSTGAWKSIAYACATAPTGSIIRVGKGIFQETTSISVKEGQTLIGAKAFNSSEYSIILAPLAWDASASDCSNFSTNPKVIDIGTSDNVKISYLSVYESLDDTGVKAAIGIYANNALNLEIDHVNVKYFFWCGIYTQSCSGVKIHNNYLFNSVSVSTRCEASAFGNIQMLYCGNSLVNDNTIVTENGFRGYGIRARDVSDSKFYNNNINIQNSTNGDIGFAMEIAHHVERNVQIYDNDFHGVVSLTRVGGNGPGTLGYTVRLYNNIFRTTYAVEATRPNIEIDHNYFTCESGKINQRVFSDFATDVNGFINIHHNVAENVQGGFFWKDSGLGKDIYIDNNTIYTAATQTASATNNIIWFRDATQISNVFIRNNILVAKEDRPGKFVNVIGIPGLIFNRNVYQNISSGLPGGWTNYNATNVSNIGLYFSGNKPSPYYKPTGSSSYVAGKGLASVGAECGTTVGAFQY